MRCHLLYLLSAGAVLAQGSLEDEIAKAAAIQNSVERLASFDAIATRHKLAPASNIETTSKGKWDISIDTSPLDDSKTVVGALDADSAIKIGFQIETPALLVRYKEGELQTYIAFKGFLGTDKTEVTTRFGKGEATTEEWGISTDHKAVFFPGDGEEFLKKLKSTETLVVRLTPYSESPVTLSFTTSGLEAVLDAIQQAKSKK